METKRLPKRSLLTLLLKVAIILIGGLVFAYGYAWLIVHYGSRTTTNLFRHAYSLLV